MDATDTHKPLKKKNKMCLIKGVDPDKLPEWNKDLHMIPFSSFPECLFFWVL